MQTGSHYRQRRIADELYSRSLDGPLFYALGCLLVAGLGERPWLDYPWHGLAALLYLGSGWLRRRHRVPAADAQLAAWQRRHFATVHVSALVWSLLVWRTAWLEGAHATATLVALLCTATYGSASATLFAIDRRQCLLVLTLLLAPVALLMLPQQSLRPLSITLACFALYLITAVRRWSQLFKGQLMLEEALHASRAEVERLTLQDGLTLLANRRAYDLQVPQSWDQAHRRRAPMSLIMADIDHFKRINDSLGHAAGDAALRHFAALLRQHFRRAGDLPVRLGGEEFVVLLMDCTLHDATELAESFRARLAASAADHEGKPLPMTASFGVAQAHWDGHDHPDRLLERADAALYRAKHGGRNRVEPELRE
jgi:diguanylate cyclase